MTVAALLDECRLERNATVADLLRDAAVRLHDAGIESARLDAKVLLMHALQISRETLNREPERLVDGASAGRYAALIERRARREPVGRLTGVREFWSLPFSVTPEMLIPRPDSEVLIEAALARIPERDVPLRVLDLGTGSGCLLLALLSELPNAWGIGIDRALAAATGARENARRLGLDHRAFFLCADWAMPLAGSFDVIVANPPYIPSADIARLEPEVGNPRFEPRLALDGGADGLDAYRRIAPVVARLLAEQGRVILEFGAGQQPELSDLVARSGLATERVVTDLASRPRCLVLGRK